MKVFGLTGGMGMGKSAAAEILHARGVPVVDTDELARQLVRPGQPALGEIQTAFGKQIISPDGQLRREELAQIVFADRFARQKLEAILHPRICKRWQAQIAAKRNEGCSVAVVVIPLLFETDAASQFDQTICLACSAPTQYQRLLSRGWTPEQIEQRIRAQWPIRRKIELADHVVWTEGSLDVLAQQLQRIVP